MGPTGGAWGAPTGEWARRGGAWGAPVLREEQEKARPQHIQEQRVTADGLRPVGDGEPGGGRWRQQNIF